MEFSYWSRDVKRKWRHRYVIVTSSWRHKNVKMFYNWQTNKTDRKSSGLSRRTHCSQCWRKTVFDPKIPEKLISVISPAGLLLTSGFVGRAAGGGSKFESVEFELKKNMSWNSGLVLVRDRSGILACWDWSGTRVWDRFETRASMGKVQVYNCNQFGTGFDLRPVTDRFWSKTGLRPVRIHSSPDCQD